MIRIRPTRRAPSVRHQLSETRLKERLTAWRPLRPSKTSAGAEKASDTISQTPGMMKNRSPIPTSTV